MDNKEINHVESRDWLINELKKEVIGPEPFGEELDTSSPLSIDNDEFKNRRFVDKNDGQEIMFFESPLQKYGTGILFPRELLSDKQEVEKNNDELNEYTNSTNSEDDEVDTKNSKNLDKISTFTNNEEKCYNLWLLISYLKRNLKFNKDNIPWN